MLATELFTVSLLVLGVSNPQVPVRVSVVGGGQFTLQGLGNDSVKTNCIGKCDIRMPASSSLVISSNILPEQQVFVPDSGLDVRIKPQSRGKLIGGAILTGIGSAFVVGGAVGMGVHLNDRFAVHHWMGDSPGIGRAIGGAIATGYLDIMIGVSGAITAAGIAGAITGIVLLVQNKPELVLTTPSGARVSFDLQTTPTRVFAQAKATF